MYRQILRLITASILLIPAAHAQPAANPQTTTHAQPAATAQPTWPSLEVPGKNAWAHIDPHGNSVLPSGRFVTPAGTTITITHDPFGMAVSPDGATTVTLHDGVFTIIDNATLAATRVPSYDGKIPSPCPTAPFSEWLFPPTPARSTSAEATTGQ
ncbi:hypothetical protein ACQ86N_17375 [Puia sp. P3]|uniref:hypothetical protein n=1 Tax=Puia sp. P3 TaxID=3423952 RepID=UPI003D67B5C1